MRIGARRWLLVISLVTSLVLALVSCQLDDDNTDANNNPWITVSSKKGNGKQLQDPTGRGRPAAATGAKRTSRSRHPLQAKGRDQHVASPQAASDNMVMPGDEECQIPPSSASFTLDKFVKLLNLGCGSQGAVYLAHHVDLGGHRFAIKEISKPTNYKGPTSLEVRLVTNELNLAEVKSPFVVPLFAALQDSKKVYLVQEYAPGGTLYDLVLDQPQQVLTCSSYITRISN